MKIAEFQLHGQTIEVHRISKRSWRKLCVKENALDELGNTPLAYWYQPTNRINIEAGLDKVFEQRVLCHELAHAVLEFCGREDLSKNEDFVQLLGSHWHQVWTTIEFKK